MPPTTETLPIPPDDSATAAETDATFPGGAPAAPPPGGMLFRYRSFLPVLLAIVLVVWPWREEVTTTQLVAGGVLIAAGVALRLWCILQIGGSARKTSRLKAVRVISWGPYSLVRNPIYIANSTTFAGFTVAAGLVWLLPFILLGLFLWYNAIVKREEAFLEESHPAAFRTYKLQARRWIPSFRYRGRPIDVAPYPLLRAIKRERGHIIAVASGLLAVVALRLWLPDLWSGE